MKSLLTSLLFVIIGISTNAQIQGKKIHLVKYEKPIVIINNEIIASANVINRIPTENIIKLEILKESELSSTKLFRAEKRINGIIKAEINFRFKIKTQKELNIFFGLNQYNDIYVNGYLIENKKQNISTESITKIELIEADDIFLKQSSLNITIE